jgi:hypothetical protein
MIDSSQLNQLTALIAIGLILFLIASALPQKIATITFLVLAPMQAVETRVGSSTMIMAYVVFIALLLRRERVRLPMLPHFLFLLLWYAASMSLMHQSTWSQHIVYLYTLVSAFLVFWLTYDLTDRLKSESGVVNVFIAMNVVVVLYCAVQMALGPGQGFNLFGIGELGINRVRDEGRITGPFESALSTAQYLVMMLFLILHQLWHSKNVIFRRALVILAVINVAVIVGTGSRGDFLLLLGGASVYLWLFRHRLGTARAIKLAVSGAAILTAVGFFMVNFTQFGTLFNRLANTEFNEQGIPDTRQVAWPPVWREALTSPIIGHGPRMVFINETRGQKYEHHTYLPYPHNLYLFLFYTVGIPGLLLFVWVIGTIMARCWRAMKMPNAPPYYSDLARTGFLIILLFFIAGLKHEQMRISFADYWYFWFGLCGMFVSACHKVELASASVAMDDARSREASSSGSRAFPAY